MTDPLSDAIAANVRALRARNQWTQKELGERLGWADRTVGHLEQGRRAVTVADLVLLCQALDVPAARLLEGASTQDRRTLGF